MKKNIAIICLLMVFVMVFATIAMAEESKTEESTTKAGNIIVKVGVFMPTDDKFNTLTSTNWTLEGEYVFYSTDYLKFSGIFGYYRTGLPNGAFRNLSAHIDTIYYMGGVKYYPTKKDFYFGGFLGGATNWVKPDPIPLDGTDTSFALKACAGYEYKNFVFEASYIAQFNDNLTFVVNNNPQRTIPGPVPYIMSNNSGIQLMGGYKF